MKRRHFLALTAAPALARPAYAAGKTLTIGAAIFPDNLRAGNLTYAATSLVAQTNDFLVARDDSGALQPALALKWEAIDPTTMRFHLRPGVKFTDGELHARPQVEAHGRGVDRLPLKRKCRLQRAAIVACHQEVVGLGHEAGRGVGQVPGAQIIRKDRRSYRQRLARGVSRPGQGGSGGER